MLYYLHHWDEALSGLSVFQYITFRSGGAFITALALVLFLGAPFIRLFKRLRIRQAIKIYGPESHLAKAGTPTMGGLLILGAMAAATLLWARPDNRFIWLTLVSAVYLGTLGFVDDYRKWMNKAPPGQPRSPGLSDRMKMGGQMVLALGVSSYLYFCPPNAQHVTAVGVPYLKDVFIPLGSLYIFFAVIVLVGSSNAVNLTDGLDGLAGGTLLICAMTFGVFAYLAGHAKFSGYLRLPPVAGAGELTIYLAAMAGALMGFLWYNVHPADIFMGDTGSLFLGGTIGVAALCVKQELVLVVAGGVFVAEALSVLIQIGSVRLRKGKRVFRMAPLHHHFELAGVPEEKVTARFWITAVVLAMVALTSLKIR